MACLVLRRGGVAPCRCAAVYVGVLLCMYAGVSLVYVGVSLCMYAGVGVMQCLHVDVLLCM